MFTNDSPLVSGYKKDHAQYSPQEMEMIMRQKWNNTNTVPQSDPFDDFEAEFAQCSPTVQSRIREDNQFKEIEHDCDMHIQRTIQQLAKPYVMQDPNGRICFEKMLATFRLLKDRYIKEEAEATEQLHKMMQDEVIRKRISELTNQPKGGKLDDNR